MAIARIQPKKVKLPVFYDLGIAWNWEYDRDFVSQINNTCLKNGLKPYLVNPFNLYEAIQLIKEKKIKFRYFFDRATDTDQRFFELIHLLQKKRVLFINHPDKIKWIEDKVLIHMELTTYKIPVPETYIYYPSDSRKAIMDKIKQVGMPFVLKPAHSVEKGGMGVLLNATTVEEAYQWHNRYKDFIFLIQRQVFPRLIEKRSAWFRVFYVLGKTIPCWWNPVTHIYEVLTEKEIKKFRLSPLRDLTNRIADIYGLGLFSTEIAVEKWRRFVVVDYINDQCDMRRKSKFVDAVCDEIVDAVVSELVTRLYSII